MFITLTIHTNRKPPALLRLIPSFFISSFFIFICWHICSTHGRIHRVQHPFHQLVYESCRSQTTFIIFLLVCALLAFHVRRQIHLTHISYHTPTFFVLIHLPLGRVDPKYPTTKSYVCMHMRIVIYAVTELLYHIYIMLLVLSKLEFI